VVADDPVDLAVEHGLPERFHVLARADRRIDLGVRGALAIGVEQKMADGTEATAAQNLPVSSHSPSSLGPVDFPPAPNGWGSRNFHLEPVRPARQGLT
jgi:hypothetical protein